MAPMRVEMDGGIEIKFAQKLAGNEKEGRDKALKKLKKWIQLKSSPESAESAFTELELLKLWKGLFYCMWMSDKPLVQEQLAEQLSRLVHLFPHRQDAVTFCGAFFTTMAREWHSIDVIRREKYMMLVRRVLRQTLTLLLPSADSSSSSLSRLAELCEAAFARREDPATLPLGLQLHLVEIFLEEVAKVAGDRLTESQMAVLLAPLVQVLKVSKHSTLRRAVTDSIFFHLMRQSDVGMAHEAMLNGEGLDSDDESGDGDAAGSDEEAAPGAKVMDPRAGGVDVTLPQLDVDYSQLADDLMAAGAEQTVRQQNRAALYRLAQQFRDLSEGDYPLALKIPDNIDSDSDISDEDMEAAVLRLQANETRLKKDSRKNRREQKRLRAETGDTEEEEEPEPQPKKKKKIKHKMLSSGVIDRGEEMMAETDGAAPAEEEAEEQSPGRRKTLKERKRTKLKERREAELAKQKKKKRRMEAKRAKLNGDATEEEQGMVNGVVLNGDHHMEAEEVNGEVAEELSNGPAEVEECATPVTASKKKKKRAVNEESPRTNSVATSIDESTPPKSKKKKKKDLNKSVDIEAPAPTVVPSPTAVSATENGTPSPQKKKSKKAPAVVPSPTAASATENGTPSPQKKSKKAPAVVPSPTAASTTENGTPSPQKKKSKKKQAAAETSPAPSGDAPAASPGSTFDWSLGAEDNWDDAAGGPVVPAPVTPKSASKAAKKAAAPQSAVAHFVPSKPVPAFVKVRSGKKAGKAPGQLATPATPCTPGGTKKVIINLAENKAQGFKEHLITVRNSPQVPHNPLRRPIKGLLKPRPSPSPATPKSTASRRSKAADFFGV